MNCLENGKNMSVSTVNSNMNFFGEIIMIKIPNHCLNLWLWKYRDGDTPENKLFNMLGKRL